MVEFSAIVTCKGRLEHLKETLPLLCNLPDTEVVLVDYDCPERCGEWVSANFPNVKIARVKNVKGFNIAHARNLGAQHACGLFLLFVDADIKVKSALIKELRDCINTDRFVLINAYMLGDDVRGTCVVPRDTFNSIEGYDELLSSYGMEDTELYERLTDIGLKPEIISDKNISTIKHNDDLRTKFLSLDSKKKMMLVAVFYHTYIRALRRTMNVSQLDIVIRKDVKAYSESLIDRLIATQDPSAGVKLGLKVPYKFPKNKFKGYMEWELDLTLSMKPKNAKAFQNEFMDERLKSVEKKY